MSEICVIGLSPHLICVAENRTSVSLSWLKRVLFGVVLIIVYFGLCGISMGGDKFSSQGNALYDSLLDDLIRQGVCADKQSCFNALQIYGEDNARINLNMYAQTDKKLGAIVAKYILENGLRVTNGIPITLRIFPGPKTQNLGFKSLFGLTDESVKLEVNK